MATTADEWEASTDGEALMRAAVEVGAPHAQLVLAACACARIVLSHAPADVIVVDLAEAWARGRAPPSSVRAAAHGDLKSVANWVVHYVAHGIATAWLLHHAVANTATAVATTVGQRSPARFSMAMYDIAYAETARRMAPLVRHHVPWQHGIAVVPYR